MKVDLPWVKLIWSSYYSDGSLPGQRIKGSFWWKDIVKLQETYKSLARVKIADGSTVFFWTDFWNGQILSTACPELFSFAKDKMITFKKATSGQQLLNNFHLPLSIQAHQQFQGLGNAINHLQMQEDKDLRHYIWGSPTFSTSKVYKALVGHQAVHPLFNWIWTSKC